jgi:hypothetical protein
MDCKNCFTKLPTDANYCIKCGQSAGPINKPFADIVKDTFNELLDIDGKLCRTFKLLITKPGQLSYEFSQGRKIRYTPPLRLYLAISILFFIFISNIVNVYSPHSADKPLDTSMMDYYAKAMFVLFPIFALVVQMFFRRSYYINNLVFSMHIHSVVYITLLVIAPLEAFEQQSPLLLALQVPPFLYLVWYVFMAFRTVFKEQWKKIIIKASAAYMIYMSILGVVFDILFTQFFSL